MTETTQGQGVRGAAVAGRWRRVCVGASFTRPTDIAWLAAFRILFGLTLCVSMLRFIAYGWVDAMFLKPVFHFKYWGFAWVGVLPPEAMHLLFGALALASLGMALGLFFRWTSLGFALGFGYIQLIDVATYLNHYYLAWLLSALLAVSPAASSWSLDALRKPSVRRDYCAAGWHFVFRFQVGVVYTFAGLAKVHGDWLGHGQPLGIWLGANTDLPVLGRLFTAPYVPLLMSWAGCLFDSLVIWFLLWARTRYVAYLAVLLFHATTRTLFPIGMFSVIMAIAALVFFPPDWPRQWIQTLARLGAIRHVPSWAAVPSSEPATEAPRWATGGPRRRVLLGATAAYCALQLALPLRHLAYGGNVLWHEQGMRFSWRVMVREKNGSVTFYVRDPSSGRSWSVAPRQYLTWLQEREMSTQPDLILQLAHHIRADYKMRLGRDVEIRAEALVSLNGRRPALLLVPKVNLTQVIDGLQRYDWVLPAPPGPPPPIRPV